MRNGTIYQADNWFVLGVSKSGRWSNRPGREDRDTSVKSGGAEHHKRLGVFTMNIEITDALLVAVIVGFVEIAKGMGLPVRLAPVLSVILGIIAGVVYFPGDVKTSVMFGIISGLTSCGLYSAGKSAVKKG
ncbi:hypothetical protein P7H17_20115 [Paenibacillus larvae]|nr:hypothetical protein [Paenibacillus larvae]MDT2255695.1 hypothetical protein [Paenibacillus larvae]MDT2287889.1 hypothetical protein [Paenibacillus larvae]